jgi:RND superfamily putative drug exporter
VTVLLGGATAAQYDTVETASSDARLIFPLALAIIFCVLAVLLRALVAPLYLIATVILSFAATLGLSVFCFAKLIDAPGLAVGYSTFLFILLVSLGVDYTIFLMARAREEAERVGTREGMLRALASTGNVITTAGLILGGTFAMLMLLPLWQLFQIGFGVAVGVLLDTFVVRTMLVPAITLIFGDRAWWPSRPRGGKTGPGESAILGGASGPSPAHIERG